ncbi:ParB/RepB/Spo0J family partition protein [Roseivivax isoporae]|uniref:Replication protein n=1 Tax=Roseivivax isoporae LMG 25204 TaxID=1449351 RepID=X7F7T7_9RHOB|nr:ParB N-terminal domain-containing protein [Roseivivax isoporae]ETX28870.1 replication protein [Roseivivax isoporae LMG 25204]
MSKRRVFDIDFPDEEPQVPERSDPGVPAGTGESRRSPMAAAISENADALRARADTERAIREENDRLAHEHVRLKRAGLITDLIPLDKVRTTKLTRDRGAGPDPDLEELKLSIREIGLSNPIRVEAVGEHYELVQGFRRLSAYRELHDETGDEAFATIPAGIVASGEALEALYRRMVDENLVRRDISFAEMARLALAYAEDPETSADTVEAAVATLFASAGRQKRVYVRNFAALLSGLGDALSFPEALPRALGLDLEKRMRAEPGFADAVRRALARARPADAEAELAVLRGLAAPAAEPRSGAKAPAKTAPDAAAKTTLRVAVPAGTVRLSARQGRVEIAADRDFSGIDRHRLERAVAAFMASLDE